MACCVKLVSLGGRIESVASDKRSGVINLDRHFGGVSGFAVINEETKGLSTLMKSNKQKPGTLPKGARVLVTRVLVDQTTLIAGEVRLESERP